MPPLVRRREKIFGKRPQPPHQKKKHNTHTHTHTQKHEVGPDAYARDNHATYNFTKIVLGTRLAFRFTGRKGFYALLREGVSAVFGV